MNLILLKQTDYISTNCVRLSDRRHIHILKVLQATEGSTIQTGLINGKTGNGIIQRINNDFVDISVQHTLNPPSPIKTTLILALPRPKVLKRLLQFIAATGIKHIILVNTWKVEKSYWQSPLLETGTMQDYLLLGLEQAKDTILPHVSIQKRFKPFVEDILPGIIKGTHAFVAHPNASMPCPVDMREEITLAIGPEGGYTTYEVTKLEEAGMQPIHLGQRPLRVEAAVPAFLGRLMHLSL